jgi:hypothetical protein
LENEELRPLGNRSAIFYTSGFFLATALLAQCRPTRPQGERVTERNGYRISGRVTGLWCDGRQRDGDTTND